MHNNMFHKYSITPFLGSPSHKSNKLRRSSLTRLLALGILLYGGGGSGDGIVYESIVFTFSRNSLFFRSTFCTWRKSGTINLLNYLYNKNENFCVKHICVYVRAHIGFRDFFATTLVQASKKTIDTSACNETNAFNRDTHIWGVPAPKNMRDKM